MNYYKHYMGDYQRDTGHLSLAQDGAYRRLMDHYYSTEEPLPIDKVALYRICGAMDKKERAAVDFVLKTFFHEHAGRLQHQRIAEDITKAQEKIANLKHNGAAGGISSGKARASKSEANASAKDQAKSNNTNTNNHTKPKGLDKTRVALDIELPDWLPADAWSDWVSYRQSIKAPLSKKAVDLCLAKLLSLHVEGNDPRKVIDQSILSGKWTGLYPIGGDKQYKSHGYESAKDRSRRETIEGLTGKKQYDEYRTIDAQ